MWEEGSIWFSSLPKAALNSVDTDTEYSVPRSLYVKALVYSIVLFRSKSSMEIIKVKFIREGPEPIRISSCIKYKIDTRQPVFVPCA